MFMLLTLLFMTSCMVLNVAAYPGALCNVTYQIPTGCGEVLARIEDQMKLWDNTTSCPGNCEQRFFLPDQRGPPLVPVTLEGTGEACEKCPCGQQCMYVHTETSQNIVKGSHITPVIRYVDNISFQVLSGDDDSCKIKGHSFSTGPAWYDYTTNYCNMRNLMVGAGLVELEGYKEESSTDLCMQYDRIMEFGNCNKF
eukprot:TRINITY_DN21351_c0_g1_i3.p1 TRINITY_DN21351_c0_g1~~TRINITY_DN21351_c0_g1_i3.p1  ORF type:complete len:197 (+),score=40.71 TRINITY_DN21351_c0_g1_i3:47-637(+)